MPTIEQYLATQPTPANHWRAVILFGRNSATYKFALATALLEMAHCSSELIKLEELAGPFAKHICRHLQAVPRQGTNQNSAFLDLCKKHNQGEISEQELIEGTVKLGFNNVIDAFHNLGSSTPGVRFFVDERREHGGIRVTENLGIVAERDACSLGHEVEARWRLVETAWSMGMAVPLIEHEPGTGRLIAGGSTARIDVTSSRDALNGYQKGKCFYCAGAISVQTGAADLAHVDHCIPLSVAPFVDANLNGVWNLVLACAPCNGDKSDMIPPTTVVRRLILRNEFLINSHHPLRETLISQLGALPRQREEAVGRRWADAYRGRAVIWPRRDIGDEFL